MRQFAADATLAELTIHEDLQGVGITAHDEDWAQEIRGARAAGTLHRLPPVENRALEVQRHWEDHLPELISSEPAVSAKGLYVGIFRIMSRSVHAGVVAIDPHIEMGRPIKITVTERPAPITLWPLVYTVLAFGLLVCRRSFGWPSDAEMWAGRSALDDPSADRSNDHTHP